jgi:hypothetical protein
LRTAMQSTEYQGNKTFNHENCEVDRRMVTIADPSNGFQSCVIPHDGGGREGRTQTRTRFQSKHILESTYA